MFNLFSQAITKRYFLCQYCLLLWAFLFCYGAKAQTAYTVDQLPNPQVNGRTNVCDPDGILPGDEIDSLNNLAATMKQSTGAQLAIVIVQDFNKNQDDFNFATALFRKWGIGGSQSHNGLLLFIAVNRKQYRFITGYGLEGPLPDAVLSDVGRHYIVPAFRLEAYGHGIISAISVINTYLNQPDNQKDMQALLAKDQVKASTEWYQPAGVIILIILIYMLLSRHLKKQVPVLPRKALKGTTGYENQVAAIVLGIFITCFISVFVLAYTIGFTWIKHITWSGAAYIVYALLTVAFTLKYMNALSVIRKSHTDDINYNTAAYQFQRSVWWYILFSPLILLLIISEAIKRKKAQTRLLPQTDKEGHQLMRVDRDKNITGTPYLTAGQRMEEQDGVYSYDIWLGNTAGNYKVIANEGRNFNKFDACPKCGFKTLAHPVVETVIAPTYTSKGKGKKVAHCSFCQFVQLIEMVILPVRTQSSNNSSSSGSDSSSSSSSSSDSGSYGGGSTGGGGAGGSW
jgi:uncharacterized protein